MFIKKEFSKLYLIGFFILLIIISIFSVIIFEKTTDNNNQTIKLNLDTKVDEDLSWNFSTTNNSLDLKIGQLYKSDFNGENYIS